MCERIFFIMGRLMLGQPRRLAGMMSWDIKPRAVLLRNSRETLRLFSAEFLYAGVGLSPVALALLDSRAHVDAGLKPNLFQPACSSDNSHSLGILGIRPRRCRRLTQFLYSLFGS